jgi:hypothetical protein
LRAFQIFSKQVSRFIIPLSTYIRPISYNVPAVDCSHPNDDLSDAYYYAKERWTRQGSSSSSNYTTLPYGSHVANTESSRTTAQNSEPELPMPLIKKDPPQLGPLPDLSDCNLERSSTLRACIEKSSDNFDVKHKSLCHLSKTDTCQREPNQPRIMAQPYTSRPKLLSAIPNSLERRKRGKSRSSPYYDMISRLTNNEPLRCGCEPRDGPLCALNHHASAPDKSPSVEDVKQSTEQESLSRSTSITTIQLPPSVLEKSALSREECPVLTMTQPISKPATRMQLSDRYSSLDSTLTY